MHVCYSRQHWCMHLPLKESSACLLQQTAKQSRCILRLLIFFAWCLASGAVLYIFSSFIYFALYSNVVLNCRCWMNRSVCHHLLAHWRSLRELERIHALVICIFLQYRMNADLFSLGCALLFLSLYFVFAIFRFVHTVFTVKKSVVIEDCTCKSRSTWILVASFPSNILCLLVASCIGLLTCPFPCCLD